MLIDILLFFFFLALLKTLYNLYIVMLYNLYKLLSIYNFITKKTQIILNTSLTSFIIYNFYILIKK